MRPRAVPAVLLALVVVLSFVPSLGAGFVSDAFVFLEQSRRFSPGGLLAQFVPAPGQWYRPLTTLVFWLEYRLFGLAPLGYHVVAWLCHLSAAVLVMALGHRITGSRVAAWVAGTVFVLSIHAHEIVFDAADLHNALSGVSLPACVLAWLRGSPVLALALAGITLGIDENGLLALPLVALSEAVYGRGSPRGYRLIPLALLTAAYIGLRLAVGGGFANEGVPCRSPHCLAVAVLEYLNRLFVRPEAVLALAWRHRVVLALVTALVLVALLVLLRPWRWHDWRAIGFGAGWLIGTTLFSILALYPYVADRFLYIPDMGLALLIGALANEGFRAWRTAPAGARVGLALVALVMSAWILSGAVALAGRGRLWREAGAVARSIVESTVAALPSPPPRATLVFQKIPDSHPPGIPPANTGPYLFRNGLGAALRIRYGRNDLVVLKGGGGPPDAIVLAIDGGTVRRMR